MSKSARSDGGEDQRDLWSSVGRETAANELKESQYEIEAAFHSITDATMYRGEDPTPEQIRTARMALNEARHTLEEYIAPAAGCEPWGEPVPQIPAGVLRELVGPAEEDSGGETDE